MEVKPADAELAAEQIADQVHRVTLRQQEFERQLARRLAVDSPGLAAMEHLMQTGEATPSELSRRLGVSTAAMTLVLDRLARAGHISRRPHPTDRRKVIIAPAPTSATAAQALVDPLITGVETLVASLDPEARQTVSTFLEGMLRVYDEVLDSDDVREDRPPSAGG